MVSGTGLYWVGGRQWNWGLGLNDCVMNGVYIDGFVSVI